MSIADTYRNMRENVKNAYDAIEEMGGDLPENKNIENLTAAIDSIGAGPWGNLVYKGANEKTLSLPIKNEADYKALTAIDSNDTSDFSVGGMVIPRDNVLGYSFGPQCEATPARFLQGCKNLNSIKNEAYLNSIGARFLQGCASFNQPLSLPSVKTIGNDFLRGCSSFNQPLDIPLVETIGDDFLYECASFNQPVIFPDTLTQLGEYAFQAARAFNSELKLPKSLTVIKRALLQGAYVFNQPLDLENVVEIGNHFLSAAKSYNQPINLPKCETIGMNFLANLTDDDSSSYNSVIYIPKVKSIGENFLYSQRFFAQSIEIPSSLQSIGTYFMHNCNNFTGTLVANSTVCPFDIYSLSSDSPSAVTYTTGISISGTGAQAWMTDLFNYDGGPYRKLKKA